MSASYWCIQQKELILTAYTPVVEGVDIIQYAENGLINGAMDNIVLLEQNGQKTNIKEGISLLKQNSNITFALENDESVQASTDIIKVKKSQKMQKKHKKIIKKIE